MVYCVAFNCNTGSGQGISMFTFPKEAKRRKLWVDKVKRDGFCPSDTSRLCAKHFEFNQFVNDPRAMESSGFKPKSLRLNSDAIPSIFNYSVKATCDKENPPKRKARTSKAFEKRRKIEVLTELLQPNVFHSTSNEQSSASLSDVSEDCLTSMSTDVEEVLISLTPRPESVVDAQGENETSLPSAKSTEVATSTDITSYQVGCQTTYNLISRRHAKVQTVVQLCDAETQTDNQSLPFDLDTASIQSESTVATGEPSCRDNDPDWVPDEENHTIPVDYNDSPAKEKKFIVFESSLDLLFNLCQQCGQNVSSINKKVIGSFVNVKTNCACGHYDSWNSQPMSGTMPLGNLILAGGIMFSGSSPSKALTMMNHAGIAMFCIRTYNYMQSAYLVPAINSVWQLSQNEMFVNILNDDRHLKLGGDARCCSPGHTAKYGSYSLMDLERAKILDIQLVQSNEVKNSYAMELEGLKRGLEVLSQKDINVAELVTDRHSQVKKYMRTERPEIDHYFDVWHMAKGVNSKLEKKGKMKGCDELSRWARSISNHMYWCAASSGGDGELVKQKWMSIVNHVVNIHDGHGDKFVRCQHGDLEDRSWLKKDSKAHRELENIVMGSMLLKDIQKLSPAEQTSSLESFHNIVCYFAPKSVHFHHTQMKARLYLAALHFNENSRRKQAVKADGSPIYSISYPKSRKGAPIAKEVKVKRTFGYVDELMEMLLMEREANPTYSLALAVAAHQKADMPPPVASTAARMPKEDVISAHMSRFN